MCGRFNLLFLPKKMQKTKAPTQPTRKRVVIIPPATLPPTEPVLKK